MRNLKRLMLTACLICNGILTSVSAQDKKVVLDSLPAHRVIMEITSGDKAKEENIFLRKDKSDLQSVIFKQAESITELRKQNEFTSKAYDLMYKSDSTSRKTIALKDQIISRNNKSDTFWKVVTGVLTVLLGWQSLK